MGIIGKITRGVAAFERGAERALVKAEGAASYISAKRAVYKSDVARIKAAKKAIFGGKKTHKLGIKKKYTKKSKQSAYLPRRKKR